MRAAQCKALLTMLSWADDPSDLCTAAPAAPAPRRADPRRPAPTRARRARRARARKFSVIY